MESTIERYRGVAGIAGSAGIAPPTAPAVGDAAAFIDAGTSKPAGRTPEPVAPYPLGTLPPGVVGT
jgi:hypothetical protein